MLSLIITGIVIVFIGSLLIGIVNAMNEVSCRVSSGGSWLGEAFVVTLLGVIFDRIFELF